MGQSYIAYNHTKRQSTYVGKWSFDDISHKCLLVRMEWAETDKLVFRGDYGNVVRYNYEDVQADDVDEVDYKDWTDLANDYDKNFSSTDLQEFARFVVRTYKLPISAQRLFADFQADDPEEDDHREWKSLKDPADKHDYEPSAAELAIINAPKKCDQSDRSLSQYEKDYLDAELEVYAAERNRKFVEKEPRFQVQSNWGEGQLGKRLEPSPFQSDADLIASKPN